MSIPLLSLCKSVICEDSSHLLALFIVVPFEVAHHLGVRVCRPEHGIIPVSLIYGCGIPFFVEPVIEAQIPVVVTNLFGFGNIGNESCMHNTGWMLYFSERCTFDRLSASWFCSLGTQENAKRTPWRCRVLTILVASR